MSAELILALATGILFATGAYLLLERSTVKVLLGIILFGNATNLLVFNSSRLVRGEPPLIRKGESMLTGTFADPLGQALILTAIVISFGVLAFAMILVRRAYDALGSDDVKELVEQEPKL